jgi:hypothetical protein
MNTLYFDTEINRKNMDELQCFNEIWYKFKKDENDKQQATSSNGENGRWY